MIGVLSNARKLGTLHKNSSPLPFSPSSSFPWLSLPSFRPQPLSLPPFPLLPAHCLSLFQVCVARMLQHRFLLLCTGATNVVVVVVASVGCL